MIKKKPQRKTLPMKKYTNKDELTEPGFYWWISEHLIHQKEIKNNWRIIAWHPNTMTHGTEGVYIGPIPEPIELMDDE